MKGFSRVISIIMAVIMAFSVLGIGVLAQTEEVKLPSNASYVCGDADGDAIVNSADALRVINHASGDLPITDIVRLTASDVNADGEVNSTDALYILNFKVGNLKSFVREDYNLTKIAGGIVVDGYTGCIVDSKGLGLLGYAYDTKAGCFYATGQGWQKTFGYTELYDRMAGIAFIPLDTIRVKFNYAGMQWMVQLWKGFYGLIFSGCEIGFYNRPGTTPEDYATYNVVSEEWYQDITNTFTYKSQSFTRTAKTWWLTGFLPSLQISPATTIPKMKSATTIRFTDEGLFNAFIGGLENVDHIFQNYNGDTRPYYFIENVNYEILDDLTVWFEWQ